MLDEKFVREILFVVLLLALLLPSSSPQPMCRALNEILNHHPPYVNLKDIDTGCTPLHCAANSDSYEIAAYLLRWQVRTFMHRTNQ